MIFVFQIASQFLFLHCACEAYGWAGLVLWVLFAQSWVVMFGWAKVVQDDQSCCGRAKGHG